MVTEEPGCQCILAMAQASPRERGPGWAGRLAPGPKLATPYDPQSPGAREAESLGLRDCACCSLEKEALEGSLFEVQRQLAQLEARREQLEADGQALLLAKETLTGMGGPGDGCQTPGSSPDCNLSSSGVSEIGSSGFGVWLTLVPGLLLPLRSELP